jgi:hypothetical protein
LLITTRYITLQPLIFLIVVTLKPEVNRAYSYSTKHLPTPLVTGSVSTLQR